MANSKGKLYVGTSGYQYPHWKGRFYPTDLRKRDWFDYYAQRFPVVEINNTFYKLPSAEAFQHWRDVAPEDFQYVLKFSRYGSHIKRLKEPASTIGQFLGEARVLGETLGPILVQLPPRWRANAERLDGFLVEAPDDVRWCFEFRDPSWLCEAVFDVLREHGAALCVHDAVENHPWIATADFVYMRFHGDDHAGVYDDAVLDESAGWLREQLESGRDAYAFFNNDAEAQAVADAQRLMQRLNE